MSHHNSRGCTSVLAAGSREHCQRGAAEALACAASDNSGVKSSRVDSARLGSSPKLKSTLFCHFSSVNHSDGGRHYHLIFQFVQFYIQ